MSEHKVDDLVSAYINIRDARKKLEDEYNAADEVLKNDLTQLEVEFLKVCNDINANSINTAHGIVMRQMKERFFCTDWDGFYQFVLDHKIPQILEKRIHQGNFKELYSTLEGMPPGVNVMREYGITVRKATK